MRKCIFVFDLFVQRGIIQHFTNASRLLNGYGSKSPSITMWLYSVDLLHSCVASAALFQRCFLSTNTLFPCSRGTIVLLCCTMFSLASVKVLKHVSGSTNQLCGCAPYAWFSKRYSCSKKWPFFFSRSLSSDTRTLSTYTGWAAH